MIQVHIVYDKDYHDSKDSKGLQKYFVISIIVFQKVGFSTGLCGHAGCFGLVENFV